MSAKKKTPILILKNPLTVYIRVPVGIPMQCLPAKHTFLPYRNVFPIRGIKSMAFM